MALFGSLCCPCCRAKEDKSRGSLTYHCSCAWQDCHRCQKCVKCCQCPQPLRPAWASHLKKRRGEG